MNVELVPWAEDDLDLLRRINAPEMKEHLGGPETDEQVLTRHQRYLDLGDTGRMFRVVALPEAITVGSIGYWDREWQGWKVFESGWSILPEFQGRGLAVAAAQAAIASARAERKHQFLHAFPRSDNPGSNVVCRKAGFTLMGEHDFEYPPGTWKKSNDWRVELWP